MPNRRKKQLLLAHNADNVASHPRNGFPSEKPSLEAQLLSRLEQMEQKLDAVLNAIYHNQKEVSHA